MRQFDVAHHQPHPPGYPLFILVADAMRAVVAPEWRALGAVSVLSGALAIAAVFALVRRLIDQPSAFVAAMFTATTPLYWFTAARPLSDALGLAASVGIQALILSSQSRNAFTVAAFAAGVGIGIRSQVFWLTVPLLVFAGLKRCTTADSPPVAQGFSRAIGGAASSVAIGVAGLFITAAAFFAGFLLWFVPLTIVSGGPIAYWHALFDQGAEDLSGIQMLWTSPRLRTLVDALYYALVAPWATWLLAVPVLLAAATGAAILARRNRRALMLLAIAFGPYFLFDILFQETFTVRYALPIIIPIATLAAVAVAALPQSLTIAAALPLAMYGAHIGGRSIAEYSSQPAPVFRMLADMRALPRDGQAPVLAPDRRLSFDLRRPLRWLGGAAPSFERQLPSPPQHEWLEPERYWLDGGRAPVWIVVDPKRAAIDLLQHGDARRYRNSLPYPVLLSGTRPSDVDWYEIRQPRWFVGEGWALTPEAAGVATADRKGLATGPIQGWAFEPGNPSSMMIGGRSFDTKPTRLIVTVDGVPVTTISADGPGPFLQLAKWPSSPTPGVLRRLQIAADPPADVAIEQFDLGPTLLAFAAGWHEREFNPSTGQQWRWLSRRGTLRYLTDNSTATLRISGETPLRYYSKASRLVVRAGDTVLTETMVRDDFTVDVKVPTATEPSTLVVETDQVHVPADRSWRGSTDRRELGLRIYSCELRTATVSGPGKAASSQRAR